MLIDLQKLAGQEAHDLSAGAIVPRTQGRMTQPDNETSGATDRRGTSPSMGQEGA